VLLIKLDVKLSTQNCVIYTDKFCIFCPIRKETLFQKIVIYTYKIIINYYQLLSALVKFLSALINKHNLLKVKAMETKSLVNQFNLIADALLATTAAPSEVVHCSIRATQAEMTVHELFLPLFDDLSQSPHCH